MPTPENSYKWKVSVIAQYTDSWATEYQLLINAIKAQQNTSKVHFIVFKYYAQENPQTACKASVTEYYQGATGEEKFLPSLCNLYDPQTLTSFFHDHVAPVAADAHILITWGHGAGLGFFEPPVKNGAGGIVTPDWGEEYVMEPAVIGRHPRPAVQQGDSFLNALSLLKANLSKPIVTPDPGFQGMTDINLRFDEFTIKVKDTKKLDDKLVLLSAQQLGEIIKTLGQPAEGASRRPVDLFIACNCYCQMFESGLALKDQIGIMVASETSYPITGFAYAAFFKAVQDDTTMNFASLAKNVCDNFKDASRQDAAFNYDYVSISANDLTHYDQLQSAVDALADWQSANIARTDPGGGRFMDHFLTARSRCGDFSQSACLIDLHQYLDGLSQILQASGVAEFTPLYNDFLSAQTACLKAIMPPVQPFPDPVTGKPGIPQFVSVFFPDGKAGGSEEQLYNLFFASEATAQRTIGATTWDNFIRAYHSRF